VKAYGQHLGAPRRALGIEAIEAVPQVALELLAIDEASGGGAWRV
jgi:hypothetical protein